VADDICLILDLIIKEALFLLAIMLIIAAAGDWGEASSKSQAVQLLALVYILVKVK
jgi:hypothetical protein